VVDDQALDQEFVQASAARLDHDRVCLERAQDLGEALTHTHFKAEGDVEFKAVIYVPETAPYDFYDKYYEKTGSGLKLYVRRVFISDDFTDLIPRYAPKTVVSHYHHQRKCIVCLQHGRTAVKRADWELPHISIHVPLRSMLRCIATVAAARYLSFLKGLVDSDTLPLNVSREMLQQHASLKTIKKKLVRKALDMIRKMSETEVKCKQFEKEDAGEPLAAVVHLPCAVHGLPAQCGSVSEDARGECMYSWVRHWSAGRRLVRGLGRAG
jgi:hypothetical protein